MLSASMHTILSIKMHEISQTASVCQTHLENCRKYRKMYVSNICKYIHMMLLEQLCVCT